MDIARVAASLPVSVAAEFLKKTALLGFARLVAQ